MSKGEKSKQYTLRLRKGLMEAVEKTARYENTTKTEIIRRAVLLYLEDRNPGKDRKDGDNA